MTHLIEAARPDALCKYESAFPIQGTLQGTTDGFVLPQRLWGRVLAFHKVMEYVRTKGTNSISEEPSFTAYLFGK